MKVHLAEWCHSMSGKLIPYFIFYCMSSFPILHSIIGVGREGDSSVKLSTLILDLTTHVKTVNSLTQKQL